MVSTFRCKSFAFGRIQFLQAADRMNINRSWDHIQSKFVGTGHSDMTKVRRQRFRQRAKTDYCSSNGPVTSIGIPLLVILAITTCCSTLQSPRRVEPQTLFVCLTRTQGDSVGRVRYHLLEKMLQPCGPPPEKEGEET